MGDIFAVRLKDGTVVFGQIIGQEPSALNSVSCAFFDLRLHDESELEPDDLAIERVIAILFCTRDLLDSGHWKVVGNKPVTLDRCFFPYEDKRSAGWVGATITGSGIVIEFLNAFHALAPWDDWYDPNYLDSLLVSLKKKPKNLIFKKKQGVENTQ